MRKSLTQKAINPNITTLEILRALAKFSVQTVAANPYLILLARLITSSSS